MTQLQKNFKQKIDLLNKRDVGLDDGYYFNQTDLNTATILAQITKGNEVIDLTGMSVSLSVLKPNKSKAFSVCTISDALNGKVILNFTRDMLEIPGLASFQVSVQKGERVVVSNTFYFTINNALIMDDDINDIEDMPLLVQLQSHASNIINNEEKIVSRVENLEVQVLNSEESRNKNEETRQKNEEQRQASDKQREVLQQKMVNTFSEIDDKFNVVNHMELEIANAEQERLKNENQRIDNEKIRETEYNKIYSSEEERQRNEKAREDKFKSYEEVEKKHVENEKVRESSEEVRKKNEEIRKSNEKMRADVDAKIQEHFGKSEKLINDFEKTVIEHEKIIKEAKTSIESTNKTINDKESIRDKAEQERISSEKIRKTQEDERIKNEELRKKAYLEAKDSLEKINAVANDTKLNEYVDSKLTTKAEKEHTHSVTDITDFGKEMSKKADVKHSHSIDHINGLIDALKEKADTKKVEELVFSLQEKGEYITNSEFVKKIEQKLDKETFSIFEKKLKESLEKKDKDVLENLSKKVDSSVFTTAKDTLDKKIESECAKKSDKTHKHTLEDINGLSKEIAGINASISKKLDATEITKYTSLEYLNSRLKQELNDIVNGQQIKDINDTLNKKADISSLELYQKKGDYLTSSKAIAMIDKKSDKGHTHEIKDVEGAESLQKEIKDTDEKLNRKITEIKNIKADKGHMHNYSDIVGVPKNVVKHGEMSPIDLKGNTEKKIICSTSMSQDKRTLEIKYVGEDGSLKTESFNLSDTFALKGELSQFTKNSQLDEVRKLKADKSELEKKADKSELEKKADLSKVLAIESDISGISSAIQAVNSLLKEELGK